MRSYHILENSSNKLQECILFPSIIMVLMTARRYQGGIWSSLFKMQGRVKHILERLLFRKTKTKLGN